MRFLNSIKIKILAIAIALAAIPVVVVSLLLGQQSTSAAKAALEKQVENQLLSIREIKKRQVESYLNDYKTKVRSYSIDPTIVTYMQRFSTYYKTDSRQLKDVSSQTQNLNEYYNNKYPKTFNKWNKSDAPKAEAIISKLNNAGIALQNSYIALNEAEFGEKHNLINPEDGTTYSNAHGEGHRVLKNLYAKLGVEDMYLINPDGNVVYSIQKNPDFATNLNNGPYQGSNLAKAFTTALKSQDYKHVSVSDIEPYGGDFNRPAMFFASPIQDIEEEDAFEILGVLVFKVDLKQLMDIMTSKASWQNIGMGSTGQVYLIGSDGALRSNYRALLEVKESYLEQLAKTGVDQKIINIIDLQNTSINRVKIENDITSLATTGATGTGIYTNPFGKTSLSAYAPIEFEELGWGIISSIETAEAFAAKDQLVKEINLWSLLLTVAAITIATIVGILFATMITRPIIRMSRTMSNIEQTSDLTQRINVTSKDEIGTMAEAINRMLEKFRNSLEKVAASTILLATSSEEMSAITQQTSDNVNKQFNEIDQIATAIHEMTATVQEVANNATTAASAALTSSEQASSGKGIVESTMTSINDSSRELENVAEVIEKLNQDSVNIGAVMDVIKGIAEQTNLLALNAAIEAARAGEQGRGFAVVADEVRTLASRTQKSTGEIESMIADLQSRANAAVQVVHASLEKSEKSVQSAAKAGDSLNTITQSINQINDMNTMIASAAEEQSKVTEEINANIVAIRMAAEQTTAAADSNNTASEELSRLSTELQQLVALFKTA